MKKNIYICTILFLMLLFSCVSTTESVNYSEEEIDNQISTWATQINNGASTETNSDIIDALHKIRNTYPANRNDLTSDEIVLKQVTIFSNAAIIYSDLLQQTKSEITEDLAKVIGFMLSMGTRMVHEMITPLEGLSKKDPAYINKSAGINKATNGLIDMYLALLEMYFIEQHEENIQSILEITLYENWESFIQTLPIKKQSVFMNRVNSEIKPYINESLSQEFEELVGTI